MRYTREDGSVISLDPTDTANFIGYWKGTEFGTTFENSDRVIHFVSQLKQGKSVDEAMRSSREFLFDYSDLTAFEQSVMKRIFPYYTWLRKNARLQVSQLIERPGKYRDTSKVLTGIEHMSNAEDRMNPQYIDEWAEGWAQLPMSKSEDGGRSKPYIMSMNLPFMDFNRLPDPSNIDDSIRGLFSQTAPLIKNPVELATNKSSFFNSEIARPNDNMAAEYADHMAGQFGAYNVASGFFKGDGYDKLRHLINSISGVKVNAYDYELSKAMQIQRKAKQREDGTTDTPIDDKLEAIMRLLGGS